MFIKLSAKEKDRKFATLHIIVSFDLTNIKVLIFQSNKFKQNSYICLHLTNPKRKI